MKRSIIIAACGTLLAGMSLGLPPAPAAPPASRPADVTVKGTVRSIRLPEDEPPLPPGPGRETAQLFCGTCHTTRYITIQPPFSRATWQAEITKMRTAFAAPIPSEKDGEILGYLVAVRGAEPKSGG